MGSNVLRFVWYQISPFLFAKIMDLRTQLHHQIDPKILKVKAY